jgi:hypothetical protein
MIVGQTKKREIRIPVNNLKERRWHNNNNNIDERDDNKCYVYAGAGSFLSTEFGYFFVFPSPFVPT